MWYMRCHKTSMSSGSAPLTSGRSALSMTVAAISGGSRPCAKASPQPVRPASVPISTNVAARWRTQPCENAKGSASGLFRTWILMSVIFTTCALVRGQHDTAARAAARPNSDTDGSARDGLTTSRDFPGPRARREPGQRALQVIAAPAGPQRRGFLVLHPLRDGLVAEAARQIDQRVHEGAVVGRLDDVLHEFAVDLDDVRAEPSQVAERGVARAEVVDGDAAAEVLHARDDATRVIDVLD